MYSKVHFFLYHLSMHRQKFQSLLGITKVCYENKDLFNNVAYLRFLFLYFLTAKAVIATTEATRNIIPNARPRSNDSIFVFSH